MSSKLARSFPASVLRSSSTLMVVTVSPRMTIRYSLSRYNCVGIEERNNLIFGFRVIVLLQQQPNTYNTIPWRIGLLQQTTFLSSPSDISLSILLVNCKYEVQRILLIRRGHIIRRNNNKNKKRKGKAPTPSSKKAHHLRFFPLLIHSPASLQQEKEKPNTTFICFVQRTSTNKKILLI
jgi:hypothetical protein